MRPRRQPAAIWFATRRRVWERDAGRCVRCNSPQRLRTMHIDHIVPLSRGGSNGMDNLRCLCRRCHILRDDPAHAHMIGPALRAGIIPPNWRELVWSDDEPQARPPAERQREPGEARAKR